LADGTRVLLNVHDATVGWDGVDWSIAIFAMDAAPLLGMSLLDGQDVRLQVTDGGLVTIETL
jgi:predicted aspartyl protease